MAFRPCLQPKLEGAIKLLEKTAGKADPRLRRFAVEVTRPRSVWGAHIEALKREPETATMILERVKADPSRYVQLAAGNWLNDASKTRPEWVMEICERWGRASNEHTQRIVKRGLRTCHVVNASRTCRPTPHLALRSLRPERGAHHVESNRIRQLSQTYARHL